MENSAKKAEPGQNAGSDGKSLVLLYPQAGEGNVYLQKLRAMLQSEASLQLYEAQSEKDITQQLQSTGRGLLIFCIRHKEDLTLVLNVLMSLHAYVKGKALRVIGVNEINHPQIPEMLMKRGCADVFSGSLSEKALRHKINQSLRIVATSVVGNIPLPQSSSNADAGARKSVAAPAISLQATLRKIPALALASDCWLVRKERDLRRVQGRWIVDLIGPGPSTGIWEELPGAPESVGAGWIWRPKSLADGSVTEKEFVNEDGAWVYIGRKPEFVWDLGRWRFLGDRMSLTFRKGEETLACRFKVVQGVMEFAENSPQAKQKLPLIIKSIENEVRFRNEAKAKAAGSAKFKDEKKPGISFNKEFEAEALGQELSINWEKDSDEGPELQIELEKPPEGREFNVRLEAPGEETPFNQAPQPVLRIWVAPAQPSDGEKFRPIEATPVELSEQTLVLEIPTGQFRKGDAVILVLDDGLMKPDSRSRVKGTLEHVEPAEGTDTLTLQVDPNVMAILDPIHKVFEMRQREITQFMKAARGW